MDNQLAPRIRKLRKERGLSQEALASLLDVSRQAVTKGRMARRCQARQIFSPSPPFSASRSLS